MTVVDLFWAWLEAGARGELLYTSPLPLTFAIAALRRWQRVFA